MKSINDSRMPEYKEARSRGLVEPGIVPLCNALYEAGGYPLSSCDGHPVSNTWYRWALSFIVPLRAVRPFVLFSCSLTYAKAYAIELKANSALNYSWRLISYFHSRSDELVWILEPNDARLADGDVDSLKLKDDINGLASIAARADNTIDQELLS